MLKSPHTPVWGDFFSRFYFKNSLEKLLCTGKEQILCGAEARRRNHAAAWQDGATKEPVQKLPFAAYVFLCGVGRSGRFFLFREERLCCILRKRRTGLRRSGSAGSGRACGRGSTVREPLKIRSAASGRFRHGAVDASAGRRYWRGKRTSPAAAPRPPSTPCWQGSTAFSARRAGRTAR